MFDTYAKYIMPVVVCVLMSILFLKTLPMRAIKLVLFLAEMAIVAFILWKCNKYLWTSIVGGIAGMLILLGIYAYLHYMNFKSNIDSPQDSFFMWKPNIKTHIFL